MHFICFVCWRLFCHFCRFGCVWDRRGDSAAIGDDKVKPFVLRYFLVDDTIQINDAEFERNQRRGLYGTSRPKEAVFCRRQKLPKGSFYDADDPCPNSSANRDACVVRSRD